MSFDTSPSNPQTLAQRMAQGRLPVLEALRYSMILAEALRKIHESGHVHGVVSPASIALTRNGLELLPALGSAGEITPYTAPELIQGRSADSRSDVFSFGSIMYEMLTGRPAFKAETPEMLAAAIVNSVPPPSGSPAVDRLVLSCLAKDPAVRLQRIQKLILELKLITVAVRRTESPAPARADEAARAAIEQFEAHLAARISPLQKTVDSLIGRIGGFESAFLAARGQWETVEQRVSGTEHTVRLTGERADRFESRLAGVEQAVKAAAERLERLEDAVQTLGRENARQREDCARDWGSVDTTLKSQSIAIESARTAIAQTEDLVERVVEALESLQATILEHDQDHSVSTT